jgi:hypothetical protein
LHFVTFRYIVRSTLFYKQELLIMRKAPLNTNGFGLIEALLILVVLLVLGGAGAYVYHHDHKAKTPTAQSSTTTPTKTSTTNAATTNPYVGWSTYAVGTTGLIFKYPADWTVSDTPQCDGAHSYAVYAPPSEVSVVGGAVSSYGIAVIAGAEPATASCAPTLSSLQGVVVGAQSQSQVIENGVLKGKDMLMNGDSAGTNGLHVLNSSYSAGQKIGESGLLTVNGTPFQISAGFSDGQDIGEAATSNFVSSQLYKDTLNILNSFSTTN